MRRCLMIPLVVSFVLLIPALTPAANLNAAVKRALNSELPTVNLANVSFGDAIDYLRDTSNANINVHWKDLEIVHVTKDSSVNVKLRQVPMRKALSLILEEAGGGVPLTYFLDQGVIEITTRDIADAKMITRVYPVEDLVVEIPDFAGPDLNLTSNSNGNSSSSSGGLSGSGGSSSSGGGIFGGMQNNQNAEKSSTREERGQQLVKTITSVVRPEIWKDNGGAATIAYFRGQLIVTAPRSIQEAIGGPVD